MKCSKPNPVKQFVTIASDALDAVRVGMDSATVSLERLRAGNLDCPHPAHSALSFSMTIVVEFGIPVPVDLPIHDCYAFCSERHAILRELHVDRTVCHSTPERKRNFGKLTKKINFRSKKSNLLPK